MEFLQSTGLIPLGKQSSNRLSHKLAKLKLARWSTWGDYQGKSGFLDKRGTVYIDERFEHVKRLVERTQAKRVTELACNQGVLAEHIAQLNFVDSVICCDIDEQAIDSLFRRVRSRCAKLNPMVLDFMLPARSAPTDLVEDRIRGDVVIALAVTHHLSLTQGYPFERIFRTISKYTWRHAIVEFMPLGLWNGTYAPPLPDWYSEDGFRSGLAPFFETLDRKQIQENRVVYFLKKTDDFNVGDG